MKLPSTLFLKKADLGIIFGLVFCLFISRYSQAQQAFIYVINPLEESALPGEKKWSVNNAYLDSIFDRFKVTYYHQPFPNAKSEFLRNAFKIQTEGDATLLQEALLKSRLFGKVEIGYYPQTGCSNPVFFNDPFLYGGIPFGTWQLDWLEAWCAWEITQGNPNTLIAVIDTEFRTDHEDFSGKFAYVWNPEGATVTGGCYHGTAVSSPAAANVIT